MALHSILADAAAGQLPEWAVVTAAREKHCQRVSKLMAKWAKQLKLSKADTKRWAAAGLLHDALRDEDPRLLRKEVPKDMRKAQGSILHGPAVAQRLRSEGVDDEALLLAVGFHTLGHPKLDRLGMVLCAADFLEPGRVRMPRTRERLRKKMPRRHKSVLREIFRHRIGAAVRANRPVSPYTIEFWNRLNAGNV